MLSKVAFFACLSLSASSSLEEAALAADDECATTTAAGGEACGLQALQLRGVLAQQQPRDDRAPSGQAAAAEWGVDEMLPDGISGGSDGSGWTRVDNPNATEGEFTLQPNYVEGWHADGDKEWGQGPGVENIRADNVGYYNDGMQAARHLCGGSGCALVINPPGHRTIRQVHIHAIRYASYGRNLKSSLEDATCGKPGHWARNHFPCSGKAAFFNGFPGIFTEAMKGGPIGGASVIAWPKACGGSGTIVELAFGCSIEHQIRGDYNPKYR